MAKKKNTSELTEEELEAHIIRTAKSYISGYKSATDGDTPTLHDTASMVATMITEIPQHEIFTILKSALDW